MESYLKPSKKILDLKSREKMLVRQREYLQAEKVKSFVRGLEEKDREGKLGEIG